MNKETAIALLNNLRAFAEDDDEPAIDMAIAALSEPSGDLISRADAIDAVENNSYGMGSRASVKALKTLPSADRRSGEWKPFDTTWGRSIYYCSVCEESTDVPTEMGEPIYNYCPNCGAYMGERREP